MDPINRRFPRQYNRFKKEILFCRIVKKKEENENTSMSGAAARTGELREKEELTIEIEKE